MTNMTNHTEPVNPEKNPSQAELLAEVLLLMSEKQKAARSEQAQRQKRSSSAMTIDLVELFYYFLSKLHLLIIGMVVGGVAMGFYASIQAPVYSATAKLYLMGSTGVSILSDLQIGKNLTMDYQEVFKTWEVHQMVNEQLGTSYSYSALQGMIKVTNPDDTRVLYITAKNTSSQMAADIANAYANAAKEFIVETMKTDEPSTFSIALVPGTAVSSGVTSSIIKGILLGTVLVGGVLLLIFLLDTRPKSPEDIKRYANIPTLAVIPAGLDKLGEKKPSRKGSAQ